MVKPDVKINYYAALELSNDASIEDIKKQYRKLALKYHPDRNPGKEEEFSPKFQAIQAAHEVLGDATSKAKYDVDRRKAGLYPTTSRPAAAATSRPGTSYAAPQSAWPPPPRRTNDPTSWARTRPPPGPSTPNGADRFSNFPRPAPTSKKDAEQERANVFNAWQNMNNDRKQQASAQAQAQARAQAQAQAPQAPPRPVPQRPRVPPRNDTKMPTEEQIRAGMNYRQAPGVQSPEEARSAWSQFNPNNQARPGMNRTNSIRTPRKAGFDPSVTGRDEGPAASQGGYGMRPPPPPPPPPPFPPPPPGAPPQRASTFNQPKPPPVDTNVPYAEGTRTRTPYASNAGEKTFFSSEQLRRSQSTRDATKLHDEAMAAKFANDRNRSASPHKPKSQENGSRRQPFVVQDSSGSSSEESDSSVTSPEPSAKSASRPGSGATNTFGRPRPKKTPTPPSRRINVTPPVNPATSSDNGGPTAASDDSKHDSGIGEKPQPKSMYDQFSFFFPCEFSEREQDWSRVFPFGSSTVQQEKKSTIPSWAIPSTLNPRSGVFRPRDSQHVAKPVVGGTRVENEAPSVRSYVDKIAKAMDVTCLQNQPPLPWSILSPNTDSSGGVSLPMSPLHPDCSIDQGFTFPINDETFQSTNNAKSRSEETINTAFSPTDWSKTFTGGGLDGIFTAPPPTGRKSSPLKRGRDTLSARSSRAQMASPRSQNDAARMPPPPPISTAGVTDQERQVPTSAPVEGKFAPETWKDSAWDFNVGSTRPSVAFQTLRRSSATVTTGQQASVPSTVPENSQERRRSEASFSLPTDAMDIDSTPLTGDQQQTKTSGRGPRLYSVPPSAWRQSQGASGTEPNQRRTSNTPRRASGVNLNDLSESLNATQASGLDGMQNIGSTLPFTSKASTTHPTKTFEPQPTTLPQVPRAPDAPTRLSKQSWKNYCNATSQYLSAFHNFNKDMHVHFRESLMHEDKFVAACPEALEAVGQAGEVNLSTYGASIKDDERFRECWNLVNERHAEAVGAFGEVKERVRKLVEGTGLSDV